MSYARSASLSRRARVALLATAGLALVALPTAPALADVTVIAPAAHAKTLATEIDLALNTGSPGLSAPSRVSAQVILRDGTIETTVPALPAQSSRTLNVDLGRQTLLSEIQTIRLRMLPEASNFITGAWGLDGLRVRFGGDLGTGVLATASASPLHRFSSAAPRFDLNLNWGAATGRPERVDLRSEQSGFVDQGNVNTCQTFAATAALEAALRRAGYGTLDLSEQFVNHMGKMNWLQWSQTGLAADTSENQIGVFGGGGGVGHLNNFRDWLGVPVQDAMANRVTPATAADHPHLARPWPGPWTQTEMNDINLAPNILPRSAVTADRYYRTTGVGTLRNARSLKEIEAVLAAGREVVWDTYLRDTTAPTWDNVGATGGSHAVLIVGYDRAQRELIVKNSWGDAGARDDGFTYLDSGYASNGIVGGFITGVRAPAAWPEARAYGRWWVDFDGHTGRLDLYHLPGAARAGLIHQGYPNVLDQRLGTFTDPAGNVFRVNGSVSGSVVTFYLDATRPNQKPDAALTGRRFQYTMIEGYDRPLMVGFHTDPDGASYGGYAAQGWYLGRGAHNPHGLTLAAWTGSTWNLKVNRAEGDLRFSSTQLPPLTPGYARLPVTFTPNGGAPINGTAEVKRDDPRTILLSVPGHVASKFVRILSWEHDLAAGSGALLTRR